MYVTLQYNVTATMIINYKIYVTLYTKQRAIRIKVRFFVDRECICSGWAHLCSFVMDLLPPVIDVSLTIPGKKAFNYSLLRFETCPSMCFYYNERGGDNQFNDVLAQGRLWQYEWGGNSSNNCKSEKARHAGCTGACSTNKYLLLQIGHWKPIEVIGHFISFQFRL